MKIKTILLALLLISITLHAQELDVTISVKLDMLNPSQRDYLSDFEQQVKRYMNEYRWTEVDFRGDKIPVTMEIYFTSATESKDYSAQVAIISYRRIYEDDRPSDRSSVLLRVNDARWSFSYLQGTPLYHNDFQFNPLTSFIDFYAYIIIGLDFDSYEALQGTPYYQKALTISQRAQGSSSASEWTGDANKYSRGNLMSELMNAQYEPFRNALFLYFYNGLDYLKTETRDAQRSIAEGLTNITEILTRTNAKSLLLVMFLENKREEICQVLEGYDGRPTIARNLMQADPPRAEYYRKCAF